MATEKAPEKKKAWYGMFPQLGAPVGFIAANGLFLALGLWLDDGEFLNWGWRLPFAGSILLVGIGLWVRLTILETPAFAAMVNRLLPQSIIACEVKSYYERHTI